MADYTLRNLRQLDDLAGQSARMEGGVRTGGCLCGAVRYSVRGDPVHVRRCHCADCRKESGSAFTVYAHWPVEAFELNGEISSHDGRGFCPRCGSRLLDTTDPGDTLVEIRIGSLDEAPFELKPEDGLYPLPYVALQKDGQPWEEECAVAFGADELARQGRENAAGSGP